MPANSRTPRQCGKGTDALNGSRPGNKRLGDFAVGSGILGWVLDAFDFFVVVFFFDILAGASPTCRRPRSYTR